MKKSIFILFLLISISGFGQEINLPSQLQSNNITVINRQITEYGDEGVELDAKEGEGLAILNLVEFTTGTIHVEIKGENAPGRSFVGLALNVQNDSTYEAIYFRPFNFVADESNRRKHMAQYIYHPIFTWHKLRQERTDEFEGELRTPPSPDDWFLAKVNVTAEKIKVFVNQDEKPVLEIERLAEPKSSKIGLWTGNGSSGRFRNLVIKSK